MGTEFLANLGKEKVPLLGYEWYPTSCRPKQKPKGSSDQSLLEYGAASSLEVDEDVKGHPKNPTGSRAQGEIVKRSEQHGGRELVLSQNEREIPSFLNLPKDPVKWIDSIL